MRTIDEIKAELHVQETQNYDSSHRADVDDQHIQGLIAGFKDAINLIEHGKSQKEAISTLIATQTTYRSNGDDRADTWETGWETAFSWCAEQYDWDAQGQAIFRADNIWGYTV